MGVREASKLMRRNEAGMRRLRDHVESCDLCVAGLAIQCPVFPSMESDIPSEPPFGAPAQQEAKASLKAGEAVAASFGEWLNVSRGPGEPLFVWFLRASIAVRNLGRITDSQLESVRSASDLVAVMQSRMTLAPGDEGVLFAECWRCGGDVWVHKATAHWECQDCEGSGNVFTFVQEFDGIRFPESVRIVAKLSGVDLDA